MAPLTYNARNAPTAADPTPPSAADAAFFNAKVLPVLKANCYSCHSHESGKAKGGLVVDSAAGLRKGSSSGPALVPGKPEKSLLVRAVHHENDGC